MAKRRRRKKSSTRTVYRRASSGIVRAVAPVVVRERVAVAAPKHRRRHHSGGGGVGGVGGFMSKENVGLAMGAVGLGFIDRQKMFEKWTIPGIGRAGTIAIAGYFVGKHFHLPLAHKISKAAIVIAAYELGKDGKISGVDVL